MSPPNIPGWPYGQIWESLVFEACRKDLCAKFNISDRRFDEILNSLMWALGADPLQFDRISDSDAFGVAVRGGGVHPDLLVVFTFHLDSGYTSLEWVGEG